MRITASWVWVFGSAEYKDVARDSCTMPGSPRLRHPDHSSGAVVLEAVKAKPFGGPPKGGPAVDRSCARQQQTGVGSGRRNGLCQVEQRNGGDENMDRTLGEPS
jgi:hypothetical protein